MPPRKVQEADHDSSELDELTDENSEFDEQVEVDYKPRNKLEEPRNKTLSVEILYAMMHCGDIDLDPEYQRGFVWTLPKQTALIDSLYRNFYVPPVILHHIVDKKSETEKWVCIDGKQRLTSIQHFIDGWFPHIDQSSGIRYWSPKAKANPAVTKIRGKILSDGVMGNFYKKQVVCIEYTNLSGLQEREIFNRVQMGMPLSSAEKMSAISSPRTNFVRKLEKKMADWPTAVKMADDRKRRFQVLGHFLRGLSTLPKIAPPSGPSLEKWFKEPTEVDEPDVYEADIDTIIQLAKEYSHIAFPSSFGLRFAPVEFIYAAIIVHKYRQTLQPEQLALAIRDMRRDVRAKHDDIRTNSRICLTLDEFVTKILEHKVEAGEYAGTKVSGTPIQGAKRKRKEDDDEDYKDDTMMDTTPDHKPPSPRKKRGPASTSLQTPPVSTVRPSVGDTPSSRLEGMHISPATSTPSHSSSSRADSVSRPQATRTTLSGAIAPAIPRRTKWGSGLDSFMGAFNKGNNN